MNALTADVAQRIVVRTMAVIGRNVNVMDGRGLILATGDPARRGMRHEGALVAAQHDRVVVVDNDHARLLEGVQPGVNVPLRYQGQVVGVVGISGDPAEVRVYADLIRVAAELMVEQAGSLESGQRLQQEREDFLVAVVDGRLAGPAVSRRGVELGIAVDTRRGCTLVRPVREDGVEPVGAMQRLLARTSELLVARTRPEELTVWWPAAATGARDEVRRALAEHGDGLVAADGQAFSGPAALRQAWLSAQDALSVAHLADDLYERRDLKLVALLCGLRDDWRAETLTAPWRALVEADRHGELRATLRAWFEHGMQSASCAADLHIHRNTLRGRLDRIEQVTGLELQRVPDLLQLYLGPLLTTDHEPPTAGPGAAAS